MHDTHCFRCFRTLPFFLFAATLLATSMVQAQITTAKGSVFHDLNRNGQLDAGEPGIPGVLVSNQKDVVATDTRGRWKLPASDDCIFFIVKPSGWMTPLNQDNLPQFYYIHKPQGSPKLKFPGVDPTGPLPDEIHFPLYEQPEPGRFHALFFGDPQPRNQKELDYIAHDVVEELMGTDAAFGVTLGDILFDDLSLFANNNALIATIGIPWYNVLGNHDIDFQADDDRTSDETFESYYGPSYYAYEYGPVVFVVMDNVVWGGAKPEGTGGYKGGLGEEQLTFLSNLMPRISRDKLVLFMMHIPLYGTEDRESLFRMIEDRPYTMSISGHTHWHEHRFLGRNEGWRGARPHHHVVSVTVSGSWWSGEPDETGIPHTLMRDGAPNGYSIIHFDGQKAIVDFKAARRSVHYQMNIHAPEVVEQDSSTSHFVYVNVFNGSEKSTVDLRVGEGGDWIRMEKVMEEDPYFLELKEKEKARPELLGRQLPNVIKSFHLWKTALPADLSPGIQVISVKTGDMYGRVYDASRSLRVNSNQ